MNHEIVSDRLKGDLANAQQAVSDFVDKLIDSQKKIDNEKDTTTQAQLTRDHKDIYFKEFRPARKLVQIIEAQIKYERRDIVKAIDVEVARLKDLAGVDFEEFVMSIAQYPIRIEDFENEVD